MQDKEARKEQERRRFKRVKKTLYVQCHPFDTTASWLSAIVQDISEAGISIATVKGFTINEALEMRITSFLRRSRPIRALGKVVSCEEKKIGGTNWVTHISFTDIHEEDKPILQELIQTFLKTTEGFSQKGEGEK